MTTAVGFGLAFRASVFLWLYVTRWMAIGNGMVETKWHSLTGHEMQLHHPHRTLAQDTRIGVFDLLLIYLIIFLMVAAGGAHEVCARVACCVCSRLRKVLC